MKKISHQIRVSIESDGQVLESPKGRLFFDDTTAQFTDLSGVRILRCGVDTVRQLYNGKLRPEVMALFDLSVDVVEFAGYEWSKGRIGRDSGYQYRLQNAEMGLILLIKNHNIKVDTIGSHLKIEVSPHALDGADPRILQGVLDDLAAAVLSHCETNQAAVHIALDVQGWNTVIFANTKSKRVRSVPISEELGADLRRHWQTHGPFTNCLGVFRLVLLSTSIKLPKGQASHVLRHTFASHFIMNGGHIVTLQHILGHASLSMTMRYAHLSQDHLSEAVRFNPLIG
ncbi:TPA: tyrosine-type recombinase/integrase [Pseudomonas aeruginosa]|nr:tyrosine-type recombinase/integrase [Pseudomonas aeruginosa]EZO89891.1 hypothetical protein V554_06122 [Pseudomonas aeruginosa BWH053]